MACAVCDHCQVPLSKRDSVNIHHGHSYHSQCLKCYVCSETNLRNADVFKGVIFCWSCSKRIFQGCSSVKKSKVSSRRKRARSASRRRQKSWKGQDRKRGRETSGIIELTRFAVSTDSDSNSSSEKTAKQLKRQTPQLTAESKSEEPNLSTRNCNFTNSMKKESAEIGVTTVVTQELLQQLNCPVVMECRHDTPATTRTYRKKTEYKQNRRPCSDIRIAELGASTEIANMALKNKSEQPVIIRSNLGLEDEESYNLSLLEPESGVSSDGDQWCNSGRSSQGGPPIRHLLNGHVEKFFKMPYKCFKKNVWDQSSLINIIKKNEGKKDTSIKKLRAIFYEKICQHYRRELRRLYPTINRRHTPYKLGWMNVKTKVPRNLRCKHLSSSESYQCMRSHVMRLAGPTKSELAVFRLKIKDLITPSFIKNMLKFDNKYALKMSIACGNDVGDISGTKTPPVHKDPLNIVVIK